ncbi:MAG: hypothetical protein LBU04_06550 [Christensenellaceae bacterium]|jgi:hypothetical protein|nr:hypothetical protein [Christensenellaceae bacterium]
MLTVEKSISKHSRKICLMLSIILFIVVFLLSALSILSLDKLGVARAEEEEPIPDKNLGSHTGKSGLVFSFYLSNIGGEYNNLPLVLDGGTIYGVLDEENYTYTHSLTGKVAVTNVNSGASTVVSFTKTINNAGKGYFHLVSLPRSHEGENTYTISGLTVPKVDGSHDTMTFGSFSGKFYYNAKPLLEVLPLEVLNFNDSLWFWDWELVYGSPLSNYANVNRICRVTASDFFGVQSLKIRRVTKRDESGNVVSTVLYDNVEPNTQGVFQQAFSNGDFVITAIDVFGESSVFNVCSDISAPLVTGLEGFYKNNQTISASVVDDEGHFGAWYLDGGAPVLTGTVSLYSGDLSNGQHEIVTEDTFGNRGYRRFTVDKVKPVLVATVVNGGYAREFYIEKASEDNWDKLYWKWSLNKSAVSLSDYTDFTTNSYLTLSASRDDGWYSIMAVDRAGNQSDVYYVCLDTTLPILTEIKEFYKAGETISGTIIESNLSGWSLGKSHKGSSSTFSIAANDLMDGVYCVVVFDKAGNESVTTFVVDKTPPKLTSTTVLNGGFTNITFTIEKSVENNWDELYWQYGESKQFVSKGSHQGSTKGTSATIESIENDGWYSFIAIDKAGNESEVYYVCLDKTLPVIMNFAQLQNSYYKRNCILSVTVVEKNSWEWYLDGIAQSGVNVSITVGDNLVDGEHTVKIVDVAENECLLKFNVDKTSPTLKSSVLSGGYTKLGFSVSIDREDNWRNLYYRYSSIKDNVVTNNTYTEVTNSTSIAVDTSDGDGWYTFIAIDLAGNQSAIYYVCLDKTPPLVEIVDKNNNKYSDGALLSSIAYFPVTENFNSNYTYNFSKKINGTYDTTSYNWLNYFERVVYFDKRIVDFSTIVPSSILRSNVFYSQKEALDSIEKTEQLKVSGPFSGWTAGISGYSVAPGEESYSQIGATYYTYKTVNNGSNVTFVFFNKDRLADYIRGQLTQYLSNASHNYFWEEGEFRVIVTDDAGNVTTKYFTIDLTKPTFEILSMTSVSDNKIYSKLDIEYECRDELTEISKIEYRQGLGAWKFVNTMSLNIEKTLANQGVWVIRCYDGAGNVSAEIEIILDSLSPTLTLSSASGYSDGKAHYNDNNSISLNIDDSNFLSVVLESSAGSETLTNQAKYKNVAPSSLGDGSYLYVVKDCAGNEANIGFVVDNLKPSLTTDKAIYGLNSTVYIYVADLNLKKLSRDNVEESRREISVDELATGSVVFEAVDFSGNKETLTITIDKILPVINVDDYYNSNTNVTLVVTDNGTGVFVYLDDKEITTMTFNFVGKPDNGYGSHTVKAVDLAGNSTTKTFFYGTTAPTVYLLIDSTPRYSSTEAIYVGDNLSVELIVQEPQYNRTVLNGEALLLSEKDANTFSFIWDTGNLPEGTYVIAVYDNAQNQTKVTLVVDKTVPTIDFSFNSVKKTTGVYLGTGSFSVVIKDNQKLTPVSFMDTIRAPGSSSELTFNDLTVNYENGKKTIIAIDGAGNETRFDLTIDTIAPVVFTEKNGVTQSDDALYVKGDDEIRIDVIDDNLDRIEVAKGSVRQAITIFYPLDWADGTYAIIVYDKAGNFTQLTYVVDKIAPVLILQRSGISVPDGSYYNAVAAVSYRLTETNRGIINLDGSAFDQSSMSTESLGDGMHTLEAIDLAGNSTLVTFYVDKINPVITLTGGISNYFNADSRIGLSIDEENIEKIEFKYGTVVDLDRIAHVASQSLSVSNLEGEYTIVVHDLAGNTAVQTIIVDKIAPVLILRRDGVLLGDLYYGPLSTFSFNLTEINSSIVLLDGNIFESTSTQAASLGDGLHTIEAIDLAGNSTTKIFYVDKTSPTVSLTGGFGMYYTAQDSVFVTINELNLKRIELFNVDDNFTLSLDFALVSVFLFPVIDIPDGRYKFLVYDNALNVAEALFVIDTVAPDITLMLNLTAVPSGYYYRAGQVANIVLEEEPGSFDVWIDGSLTLERNWQITDMADGLHRVRVRDIAGHISEVVFNVDRILPEFSVKEFYGIDEIIDIAINEQNIDYIALDNNVVDSSYFNASDLSQAQHQLTVVDLAGNTAVRYFNVDLTAPVIKLYKNGVVNNNVFHVGVDDYVSYDVEERNLNVMYFDGVITTTRVWQVNTLDEREHFVTVVDKAGNSTISSFVVDRTAPNFTLNKYYIDGAVISLDIHEPHINYIELDAIIIEGLLIEASSLLEGEHIVTVTDLAGNKFSQTFTADLSAPVLDLSGFSAEGERVAILNFETSYSDLLINVNDIAPCVIWYSYNGDEWQIFDLEITDTEYTIQDDVSMSGEWSFYAVDVNGYVSEIISITLDFGLPTYSLSNITARDGTHAYTNTAFTLSTLDELDVIWYKSEGMSNYEGLFYTNEITIDGDGIYSFYVEDRFYRRSDTVIVTLCISFDFHNIEDIRNSFKQNTWYTVTLPSSIFGSASKPNISGTYSFSSFSQALNFAKGREIEYRVLMNDGVRFYVSLANEGVRIAYLDDDELDEAVTEYASRYISSRQTFSRVESSNNYYTIMPDVSGLTSNLLETPSFLISYDLPVYLVKTSFVPKSNSTLSQSYITMTYLASATMLLPMVEFSVGYNKSIASSMNAVNNYYEGYYLYREFDQCGNEQTAILFVDLTAPSLTARLTRGDGVETVEINKTVVSAQNGSFYATDFTFLDFLDNAENDFIGIYISGGSIGYINYTKGDALPQLNSEFGGGIYTLRCYDRSLNYLEFTVVIPGRTPSWFHTSLSGNTNELVVTVQKNDLNTTFISLKIAKISSAGDYTYLDYDSVGVPVGVSNMSYTFTDGGKYTCIIVDVYGVTTEFAPILYAKGLPFGILTGVTSGGVTNKTVLFSYNDAFSLAVYTINSIGSKIVYESSAPVYDANERSYSQSFVPVPGGTVEFLLVLSSLADSGIYIEYTFVLDADPPRFLITTISGVEIEPGTTVTEAFSINWGEANVSVRVSKDARAQTDYIKDTVLVSSGLYSFTIKDKVGNTSTFTIYFDNEVSIAWSVKPSVIADDVYILNTFVALSVVEDVTSFLIIHSESSIEFSSGDALSLEGEYSISIIDLYGNTSEFSLILDFTAPVISTTNVIGGYSNKTVFVSVDDPTATLVETANNYLKELTVLEYGINYVEEGTFYFKATDLAGNSSITTFVIDKHVDYALSVPNGVVTTSKVVVKLNEENCTQSVLLGAEAINVLKEYTQVGAYTIEIVDRAKNIETIKFWIIPQRSQSFYQTVPPEFFVMNIMKTDGGSSENIEFTQDDGHISIFESGQYTITVKLITTNQTHSYDVIVDSTPPTLVVEYINGAYSFASLSKKDVSAILYKDGIVVEDFTLTSVIKDAGSYRLVIVDDLGNQSTYEFKKDPSLSGVTIALICVGSVGVVVVLFFIIRARRVRAS